MSKLPHLDPITKKIKNPTPLVNITNTLLECATVEFGLNISQDSVKVFGKLESQLPGGSIKMRPALKIFEATSGNFGLALSIISKLGLDVIALVSRKLQDGVLEELKKSGIKIIDLDVDICPAPGSDNKGNALTTRITLEYLRTELMNYGFNITSFDLHKVDIETLLAKQDVINLAKLLAK